MAQPDADGDQLRSRQLPPSQAAPRLSPQRADASSRGPPAPSAAAVAEPPAMSDEKRVGMATAPACCLHLMLYLPAAAFLASLHSRTAMALWRLQCQLRWVVTSLRSTASPVNDSSWQSRLTASAWRES